MNDGISQQKREQTELFQQFLVAEGYLPTIDEDGDVVFKSEGMTFLLLLDERDSEFFSLAIPNFWSIDDEGEREQVKTACMEVTKSTKVVKVFPVRDDTWASIEMYASPIQSVQDVFKKCLRNLNYAVAAFHREMRSLKRQESGSDEASF